MPISFVVQKSAQWVTRTSNTYWHEPAGADTWNSTTWSSTDDEITLASADSWINGIGVVGVKITTDSRVSGGEVKDLNGNTISTSTNIEDGYIEFVITQATGLVSDCGSFHNHFVDYGSSLYWWNINGIFLDATAAADALAADGRSNNSGDRSEVYTGSNPERWGQLVYYHYNTSVSPVLAWYEIYVYPNTGYSYCLTNDIVDLNSLHIYKDDGSFNVTEIEIATII